MSIKRIYHVHRRNNKSQYVLLLLLGLHRIHMSCLFHWSQYLFVGHVASLLEKSTNVFKIRCWKMHKNAIQNTSPIFVSHFVLRSLILCYSYCTDKSVANIVHMIFTYIWHSLGYEITWFTVFCGTLWLFNIFFSCASSRVWIRRAFFVLSVSKHTYIVKENTMNFQYVLGSAIEANSPIRNLI